MPDVPPYAKYIFRYRSRSKRLATNFQVTYFPDVPDRVARVLCPDLLLYFLLVIPGSNRRNQVLTGKIETILEAGRLWVVDVDFDPFERLL